MSDTTPTNDAGYQSEVDSQAATQLPGDNPNVAAAPDPVDHENHVGEPVDDDEGVGDTVEELAGEPEVTAGTAELDQPGY